MSLTKPVLIRRTANRTLVNLILAFTAIFGSAQPAAAVHGAVDCSIPSSLQPLFDLLHTVGVLAFTGGVALGVIGLSVAGVMIAGPFGEDWVRRGKQVAKNTILGVIILASARMVVAFLISQLGPSFC